MHPLPLDGVSVFEERLERTWLLRQSSWAKRRDALAIGLGLCGLRWIEVSRARWRDLVVREAIREVRTAKKGVRRRIDVGHSLASSLLQLWIGCPPRGEAGRLGLAFYTREGKPLQYETIRRRVGQWTKRVFGRAYSFHCLRHTAAVRHYRATRDVVAVQKLLSERTNPVSEAALGRLAACYVLLDGFSEPGDDTRFRRLAAQVTARNEHAGEFFFTLAGWAVELLEGCLDREAPEPHTLNLLAALKLKAEDFAEAAQLYQLGARHNPLNLKWHRALARVYLESGDEKRLAEVLAHLARADPDDLPVRKKLAQIALANQDFAAAADWANWALEIDVTDAEVHRLFAEAELGRHNKSEGIEELQTAVQLDPKDARPRLALAEAYLKVGKPAEARRVLEDLLHTDPDHTDATALLEKLEENAEP